MTPLPTRDVLKWSGWAEWRINTHTGRWSTLPVSPQGPILLIGCGTTTAISWARSFPNAQIRALDPSTPRVLLTRSRVVSLKQRNVVVEMGGPEAIGPDSGPYSVVAAQGVLERLEDPASGLRQVRDVLAPGGIVRLRIPSARQRVHIREFGELLDLLHGSSPQSDRTEIGASLTHGVDFTGSRMFDTVNTARDLFRNYERAWEDAYVTPASHVFTVTALFELLESAGLVFLSWVRPDDWHLGPRLTDQTVARLFAQMPEIQRWEFVDRLRAPHFELYCGRAEDPEPTMPWLEDDEMLLDSLIHPADTYEQISHQGVIEDQPTLRPPYRLLPVKGTSNEMTLQTPGGFELPIHTFHESLLGNMDGIRTLREAIELTATTYRLEFATAARKLLPLTRSLIHPHEVLVLRPPAST
jgi:SAM-dependent methyltransferase